MLEDKPSFHVEQSPKVPRETVPLSEISCPLCGKTSFSIVVSAKDYTATKETFNVSQCDNCNFLLTLPRPIDHTPYYDSVDYISHSDTKRGIINRLYHLARNFNLKTKFKLVKKYAPGKIWLDYGSGHGAFLQFASQLGMQISGVEIHDGSRAHCQKLGYTVVAPSDYLNKHSSVDCITMWHVLEHVENLHEVFTQHHSNLTSKGTLIIAVPNPESKDAEIYQAHWAAYDVPRHLWHFKEKDIQHLAAQHNFEYVGKEPMLLDAFYISMLSEKYKNGNMFRAIANGIISNLYAAFKSKNFSSQIYILRKKA